MAFGNEIRDFLGAFEAGAKLKDMKKHRDIEEQAGKDRVAIAAAKDAAANKRFDMVYDQNERKLAATNKRYDSELDLKNRGLKSLDDYRTASIANQRQKESDTSARQLAADKERRRIQRLKEDPTSVLDEQDTNDGEGGTGQTALPTSVTASGGGANAGGDTSQALPVKGKGEGISPNQVGSMAAAAGPASIPVALAGGLKYLNDHFGLTGGLQGQSPQQQDGARRLFEGEGSATPDELSGIDQKIDDLAKQNGVDPKTISDSQRQIKRLTTLYNYHLAHSQPEKANAAAASIIQASRGVASMLGQQALQKLQNNDIAGAAADVVQAHDQIPDGYKVAFDPKSMSFAISDEQTGDEVQKGQVTPQMIFQMANGMKDGSAFYRIIMDAAKRDKSMKEPAAAKAKEEKPVAPMKPGDFDDQGDPNGVGDTIHKKLSEMTSADGVPLFDGASPDEIIGKIGPEYVGAIHDLGMMIGHYNGLSPSQSGELALSLVNPDLSNTEKPGYNFKLINGDKNTMEVMAEDGTRLRLPARTASALIKKGNEGLYKFARMVDDSENERDINTSIRSSELGDLEDERKANAKKAADKSATAEFDRQTMESVHGPGGQAIDTEVSGIPIVRRRPPLREARGRLRRE